MGSYNLGLVAEQLLGEEGVFADLHGWLIEEDFPRENFQKNKVSLV